MEVHHHAHPSTGTGRKKWTHYFWEFLMLFLAVFCGFLAEYQLEYTIEKHRAKQYVLSMYEDFRTDTARLNDILLFDDDKIAALENMEPCYDSLMKEPSQSSCMTNLILHTRGNRSFDMTDRTLTQLMNAGGFRILKKEDADSILSFVTMYKAYQDFQVTVFQTSQDNIRNTLNELVSFKSVRPLLQKPGSSYGTTTSMITSDMVPNGPLLFSGDKFLLNKWFNQLAVYLRITMRQRSQLKELKEKLTRLLGFFQEKYDQHG